MTLYEMIALKEQERHNMSKKDNKKVSPEHANLGIAEKVSPDNVKSIFIAGFMSGMAYHGSPKYRAKDDDNLAKAMNACDEFWDVLCEDSGSAELKSVARILGLSGDEK